MRVIVTVYRTGRTLLDGQSELMSRLVLCLVFWLLFLLETVWKNAKRGSVFLFDTCQRSNSSYYFYLRSVTHVNKTVITKMSSSVVLEYLSPDLYIQVIISRAGRCF